MEVAGTVQIPAKNSEFRPNSGEAKTENYKNEFLSSELCF